ncbi:UNVERIFIED_ORG: hypothetical protein RHOFW104R5_45380 [Rhodanobacter sp. FW104-R5]
MRRKSVLGEPTRHLEAGEELAAVRITKVTFQLAPDVLLFLATNRVCYGLASVALVQIEANGAIAHDVCSRT